MSGLASGNSAPPLSVGLNLVYLLEDSGGSGTYARELIRGMLAVEPKTRITAFVSAAAPSAVTDADWARTVEWVRFPFEVEGGRPWTIPATIGSQWGGIPVSAWRRRLDLIHGLANVIPPLTPGIPTVVTILDLIWIRFPRTMGLRGTLGMRIVTPTSARFADRVISISGAARDDLLQAMHLDPTRVDVTHLGIRLEDLATPQPEAQLRARLEVGEAPVILYVGQKREHKNLAGLIRALPHVRDRSAVLVLAGAHTDYEAELRELARRVGVEERVRFLGWISDSELEGLYRLAACFVLGSFQEGFGLPILEAMRRDVPVACSNVSSLPEVAGDAALQFDPHSPEAIADAVSRLIDDRRLASRLVERGRERCKRFTWEATARATLATYRQAIEDRRHRRRRRRVPCTSG